MNGSEMLTTNLLRSSRSAPRRLRGLRALGGLRGDLRPRAQLRLAVGDDDLTLLEALRDHRLIALRERDLERAHAHRLVLGHDVRERALRPALHHRRGDYDRVLLHPER